ncbi:uncharacterized protein BXZ73DRAFT_77381 [Epithele typhae]|uniref:uncharacterized protein n=1 Tax=Epithele typhae TaxID=378194 RepID=UPI00200731E1|nr:uncharacterized protein BXZ73DRAFT_77381 [Epithele typhae]KAH9933228.1 hypothetical protein BXZ73DRAFT_77381 [Epithele typhae]
MYASRTRVPLGYQEGNQAPTGAPGFAASDAQGVLVSALNAQRSRFHETCTTAIETMDGLAEVHHFMKDVVAVFKTCLQLELDRVENDGRAVVLHLAMIDMMRPFAVYVFFFGLLEHVPGDITHEMTEALEDRLPSVTETIIAGAKLCDSWSKRSLAVKVTCKGTWCTKFVDMIRIFAELKADIVADFQRADVDVDSPPDYDVMVRINADRDWAMGVVFERMRSSDETDVAKWAERGRGAGANAPRNNAAFHKQLVEKVNEVQKRKTTVPGKTDAKALTVKDFEDELSKSVEETIESNKAFDRKFHAKKDKLQSLKDTITHSTDRTISQIQGGPHERIIDLDMHYIWFEEGWKGSAKARHFVMAVRDYFALKQSDKAKFKAFITAIDMRMNAARGSDFDPHSGDDVSAATADSPEDDTWALESISVLRVQPIIEAMDEDVSSFITIQELNDFTSARPEDWSLPRWIAYWASGFEMTAQWYFRRIRRLFAEIATASLQLHPGNRAVVSSFVSAPAVTIVECMLYGLRDVEDWDNKNWGADMEFQRFSKYVSQREEQLERELRYFSYDLDEDNCVSIVTGGGRIEKRGATELLHEEELNILDTSMKVLLRLVGSRAQDLQAIYKLQNLEPKSQMLKFSYGLFYALGLEDLSEIPPTNWERTVATDMSEIVDVSLPPGIASAGEHPLFYNREDDEEGFQDQEGRRDLVSASISCDGCDSTLVGTGKDKIDGMVDFCSSCFTANPTPGDTGHRADHTCVQLRVPCMQTHRFSLFDSAKDLSAWVPNLGPGDGETDEEEEEIHLARGTSIWHGGGGALPPCAECQSLEIAGPYWACMDCSDLTVVCFDCNARVEERKPWLHEDSVNADGHAWTHTMVSVHGGARGAQGGAQAASGNAAQGADALQFARMEAKVDAQASQLRSLEAKADAQAAQLKSLESLLREMAAAMQGGASGAPDRSRGPVAQPESGEGYTEDGHSREMPSAHAGHSQPSDEENVQSDDGDAQPAYDHDGPASYQSGYEGNTRSNYDNYGQPSYDQPSHGNYNQADDEGNGFDD